MLVTSRISRPPAGSRFCQRGGNGSSIWGPGRHLERYIAAICTIVTCTQRIVAHVVGKRGSLVRRIKMGRVHDASFLKHDTALLRVYCRPVHHQVDLLLIIAQRATTCDPSPIPCMQDTQSIAQRKYSDGRYTTRTERNGLARRLHKSYTANEPTVEK